LLLVVFGSLIAAGIPVLLAITSVAAAISLLSVIGQWLPVGQSTSEVVLVIGMAVGVDYSLFYLRREREERARGASPAEALRIAAGTSGKAVVISGLTVMVTLAGLFLTGLSIFDGIGLGSIAVVGIAVAGSLTVLPALLSWLGPRAEGGRIPLLRRATARPSRLWGALVRRVVARPLAWGAVTALALLALAAPALGMRIGSPAIDAPAGLPVVQTLDRIQQAFPQGPSPAEVVVTGSDLGGPAVTRAVAGLAARATPGGAIHPPVTAVVIAGGRGMVISVPLAGTGTGTLSDNALLTLRDQILPSTLGTVPGVSYAVTGETASNYDFIQRMHAAAPVVFAAVAVAAFALLAVAFGSLVVPLVSIVLNLLSVGAAYGLITLIFQDGRLEGPLGYTGFGAIIAWEPLFMFVLLFGISMDYHVFLLTRIRELRLRGSATAPGPPRTGFADPQTPEPRNDQARNIAGSSSPGAVSPRVHSPIAFPRSIWARICTVAVATATMAPSSSTSSPARKPMSRPRRTTRPRPSRRPGLAGRRNCTCKSAVRAKSPGSSPATRAGPSVSSSIAARKPPWMTPAGFRKDSVAVNATSIVP
jgi:RND superfamily putative drug exporter